MASELFVDKITGKTGTAGSAPLSMSGNTLTATLGASSTVPASIGGSMHFISKATADGTTSSIEFTSLGNHSSFKNLYFVFNDIKPETNSTYMHSQIAISGTTYKTSNYLGIGWELYSNGTSHNNAHAHSTGANLFNLGTLGNAETDGNITESDIPLNGSMFLYSPTETLKYHSILGDFVYNLQGGAICRNTCVGKYYEDNSPLTAIKFFMASGNIASGSIAMYGIKNG